MYTPPNAPTHSNSPILSSSPTVDILLATYNGEQYLNQQIASILGQTYQNFRLIIRDDLSSDNTPHLLKNWAAEDPRITILPSNENFGINRCFGELLKHATSNYIMFSDQDDLWLPQKIQKSVTAITRLETIHGTSHPLLVHTDLKVVDSTLSPLNNSFWAYSNLDPIAGISFNRLLAQNCVTGCTVIINKSLQSLAGDIPPEVLMYDYWLALVATAFGTVGIIPEATLLYRQHQSNDTGAFRYSVTSAIQRLRSPKGRERLRRNNLLRRSQITAFIERYKSTAPQTIVAQALAYKQFLHSGLFQKTGLMIQHQFYRSGILYNPKELLPIF